MSETQPPVEDVHVDTPEQAAARQMIDTYARVTHVARTEEEGDDVSIESLAPKKAKPARVAAATKDKSR